MKLSPAYQYKVHRSRVDNVKCKVDCKPPLVNAEIFNMDHVRQHCKRTQEVNMGNRHMVTDFVRYQRIGGIVRQNIERINTEKYPQQNRLGWINENLLQIEKKNRVLAQGILNAKAVVDTGNHRKSINLKERREKSEEHFQIPHEIFKKYIDCDFAQCMNKKTLHILLRPKVFFDLTLHSANRTKGGSKTLGRVVMQLYTEACPQVVLEFVRIFKRGTTSDMTVLRLFPRLWLEAELSLKNSSHWIQKPKIEYDMRAIDHGQSAGVLSFAKCNLGGFKYGVLNFSISFRPLAVLNRKRVAFGKVIQGQKIIDWVQIFGTKNGKPTQEIQITRCGALQ